PARLRATATPTPEGDYLLDGVKLWTTNGVLAELLVVMARVPEHSGGRGGITAFVVDADTPGITVEQRNSIMGLKGRRTGSPASIRYACRPGTSWARKARGSRSP